MSCDNTARLLYQYQASPALRGLMLALTSEYCSLADTLAALDTRLDIDLSAGVQLDLIGEIVGIPRPLTIQLDGEDAFAFANPGPPEGPGKGWSGIGRDDIGGRFMGLAGLAIGAMADADYRTLLRARIFSNRADATVDDIAGYLNAALGGRNRITHSVGVVNLILSRAVSTIEQDIILGMIPLAAGVRVGTITVGA